MITVKDLERECSNYNLTEFLKKCTTQELEELTKLILCDDIIGIRKKIYDALLTEKEYRKIYYSMNLDVSEYKIDKLIDFYKNDIEDIESTKIMDTMKFYNINNINYKDVVNWFPSGLSIEMCYIIYKFMKQNNFDSNKIRSLLISDFNKTKLIYNKICKNVKIQLDNILSDKNFIEFMIETITIINNQKHKTESFDKLYKKLSYENSEVITRLK